MRSQGIRSIFSNTSNNEKIKHYWKRIHKTFINLSIWITYKILDSWSSKRINLWNVITPSLQPSFSLIWNHHDRDKHDDWIRHVRRLIFVKLLVRTSKGTASILVILFAVAGKISTTCGHANEMAHSKGTQQVVPLWA